MNIDLTRSFGGGRGGVGLIGDGSGLRFGAAATVNSDGAGAVDEVEGCHVVLALIGRGMSSTTSIEEVEGRIEGCPG